MKKQIYLFIAISFIINLFQAFYTPVSEDEAYYWVWSQHLDWGYFDHPPMIAWWIALGSKVFQSELGLRLMTVLLNSFGLFLLSKVLNPQTSRQLRIFGILVFSTLVIQFFGFISTPDAPLLFFLLFYFYSFQRFLDRRSLLNVILLSISFAGLMYSKYHGILVLLFTLLPILGVLWKEVRFYWAILLSLLIYLPHFLWMIEHDFVPLQYHFVERSADNELRVDKFAIFVLTYFLGASPFLCYFVFKAIYRFQASSPFERSVWFLSFLPAIFFFLSLFKDNVQPQWLSISFVSMLLVVYWYYSKKVLPKSFYILGLGGVLLVLLLRIGLVLPNFSPYSKNQQFAKEVERFDVDTLLVEKYQEASVLKFYFPDKEISVHRTLGNRRSQYSLWDWESDYHGKKLSYLSPWVRSDRSFKAYKNYDYYLKEIPNYIAYQNLKIETDLDELSVPTNDTVFLRLRISNHHSHDLFVGKDSGLFLNANYYQDKQYNLQYSAEINADDLLLRSGEMVELDVSFKNIKKEGDYKVAIGANYLPIGTSYLSSPIVFRVF